MELEEQKRRQKINAIKTERIFLCAWVLLCCVFAMVLGISSIKERQIYVGIAWLVPSAIIFIIAIYMFIKTRPDYEAM